MRAQPVKIKKRLDKPDGTSLDRYPPGTPLKNIKNVGTTSEPRVQGVECHLLAGRRNEDPVQTSSLGRNPT